MDSPLSLALGERGIDGKQAFIHGVHRKRPFEEEGDGFEEELGGRVRIYRCRSIFSPQVSSGVGLPGRGREVETRVRNEEGGRRDAGLDGRARLRNRRGDRSMALL